MKSHPCKTGLMLVARLAGVGKWPRLAGVALVARVTKVKMIVTDQPLRLVKIAI